MNLVYTGMYEALREAGASEEKALAAVADLPIPQHLASKEDLLEAISGVNDRIAAVETGLANLRAEVKTDIADLRTEVKTDIANLRAEVKTEISEFRGEIRRELAVIKWAYLAYGPIALALLVKIAFFG